MISRLDPRVTAELVKIVGTTQVRVDGASLEAYGQDALGEPHLPDLVLIPANTQEIAAIARV